MSGVFFYSETSTVAPPNRYFQEILERAKRTAIDVDLQERLEVAQLTGYLGLDELAEDELLSLQTAISRARDLLIQDVSDDDNYSHNEALLWANEVLRLFRQREDYTPSSWLDSLSSPKAAKQESTPETAVDLFFAQGGLLGTKRLVVDSVRTFDGEEIQFADARFEPGGQTDSSISTHNSVLDICFEANTKPPISKILQGVVLSTSAGEQFSLKSPLIGLPVVESFAFQQRVFRIRLRAVDDSPCNSSPKPAT
jgi:hypothetical protein